MSGRCIGNSPDVSPQDRRIGVLNQSPALPVVDAIPKDDIGTGREPVQPPNSILISADRPFASPWTGQDDTLRFLQENGLLPAGADCGCQDVPAIIDGCRDDKLPSPGGVGDIVEVGHDTISPNKGVVEISLKAMNPRRGADNFGRVVNRERLGETGKRIGRSKE